MVDCFNSSVQRQLLQLRSPPSPLLAVTRSLKLREWKMQEQTAWLENAGVNKYLAIANTSRVSCRHNMSRASMIFPWPRNLGLRSRKVTGNGTIKQIIYDLLLVELLNAEYYGDLDMWVRGHSISFKLVPVDSLKNHDSMLSRFHLIP